MFDNEVHRVSSGRHCVNTGFLSTTYRVARASLILTGYDDEAIAHLDIVECMTAVCSLLLE